MKLFTLFIEFQKNIINKEIEALEEYVKDFSNLSKTETDKIEKHMKEVVKSHPEQADDIYEYYSEQHSLYGYKYSVLTNNGSFVSSYSFFEYQLKEILRVLKKHTKNSNGIFKSDKSLCYTLNLINEISTISGLDFSSLKPLWGEIDSCRKIRNVITHNGANLIEKEGVSLQNQQNYKLINSKTHLEINTENGDFYISDKAFVLNFIDCIHKYLKQNIIILEKMDKNNIT